jgi:hypothetical protein
MSYYDSETEIYEDEQEKDRNLFRYDNSLLVIIILLRDQRMHCYKIGNQN